MPAPTLRFTAACARRDTVTVVAGEDSDRYVLSAAFVAVTVHVPCDVYESVDPATEQPAVPAVVTANVTAPVPDPPVVVSESVEPTLAEMLDSESADCAIREIVMVVAGEEITE